MTTPLLPKKVRKSPTNAQRRTFGDDVKLDEKGRPIEQGIGAKGNESIDHYVALAKYEPTPDNIKLRDDALKEHAERVANNEADEKETDA